MSLNDEINFWETRWCSDSEGMNPDMREELDNIHKAFIKELKAKMYDKALINWIDELAGEALI